MSPPTLNPSFPASQKPQFWFMYIWNGNSASPGFPIFVPDHDPVKGNTHYTPPAVTSPTQSPLFQLFSLLKKSKYLICCIFMKDGRQRDKCNVCWFLRCKKWSILKRTFRENPKREDYLNCFIIYFTTFMHGKLIKKRTLQSWRVDDYLNMISAHKIILLFFLSQFLYT